MATRMLVDRNRIERLDRLMFAAYVAFDDGNRAKLREALNGLANEWSYVMTRQCLECGRKHPYPEACS